MKLSVSFKFWRKIQMLKTLCNYYVDLWKLRSRKKFWNLQTVFFSFSRLCPMFSFIRFRRTPDASRSRQALYDAYLVAKIVFDTKLTSFDEFWRVQFVNVSKRRKNGKQFVKVMNVIRQNIGSASPGSSARWSAAGMRRQLLQKNPNKRIFVWNFVTTFRSFFIKILIA